MHQKITQKIIQGTVKNYISLLYDKFTSKEERIQVLMLLIMSIMLIFINQYLILDKDKTIYQVIPFIQILAIIGVDLFSADRDFKIIIIVVVLSILNEYPVRHTVTYGLVIISFYIGKKNGPGA